MRTLVCLFAAALTVSFALTQPKLQVVEGTKLELGTLYRGTVIEKKVTLRNIGTEELVVVRVEASCGCTGALVSNDHLAPGETGTLLITFNSGNFAGQVHKTITVTTNTDDSPRTTIEFTATVVEEIVVAPAQFFLKDVELGVPRTVTFTVRNDGKEDLKLTGFQSHVQGFSVKLPSAAIKPGESIQLTGELTLKEQVQIISGVAVISTSNSRQPEIIIPIYGNVKEYRLQ